MTCRTLPLLALLTCVSFGCSTSPPPRFVRVDDLGAAEALTPGQALVIEFKEGDSLPLDFVLAGPLIETQPGTPPIVLRAKRKFFLRIDEDGLSSSLDGKDFSKRAATPGSFRVGVGATKEGARANITINGPTPNGAD